MLAANSSWIEFYARRGFDILTYKTLRSRYRKEHPLPQWVFLKDPQKIVDPTTAKFVGPPDYWPNNLDTISMANSFGVPSLDPAWWVKDVQRARNVLREGHQVLIVSVVASVSHPSDAIIKDFVDVAKLANEAGAQIIEANYSCPNVKGDRVGDVYTEPELAADISKAIKKAIDPIPLFVKIGYLPEPQLREFVHANAEHIDGIVAINTISAEVKKENGEQTFPDNPKNPEGPDKPPVYRATAGISGWAIKERAQEVARNLVKLRNEIRKRLTILGVGGVTTPKHVEEYFDIGVDAVESCTGAFLNPNLALDTRLDREAARKQPNSMLLALKVAGKLLEDFVTRPTKSSRIRVDKHSGVVTVEPLQD